MIYERIRGLREDHDLTQSSLGELINVPQRTYSYYENGLRKIPIEVFCSLSDVYHVSIDYLVGKTDEKMPYPPPKNRRKNQNN